MFYEPLASSLAALKATVFFLNGKVMSCLFKALMF